MKKSQDNPEETPPSFNDFFELLPQATILLNKNAQLKLANKAARVLFDIKNNHQNFFQEHWRWFDEKRNEITEEKNPVLVALNNECTDNPCRFGVKKNEGDEPIWFELKVEKDQDGKGLWLFFTDISTEVSAQEKGHYQIGIQQLLMKTSSDLLQLAPEEFDKTVNRCMGKMGEFIGSDRLYIFSYDFIDNHCSNTYEWCAEGIEPQIHYLQQIPLDNFHDWVSAHKKGETLHIPDVELLDHQSDLYKALQPQHIQSLVAVPMMKGEECLGFIGLDSVRNRHDYSEHERSFLHAFADMFVNVQNRVETNKHFQQSEAKFRQITENIQDLVWVVDLELNPTYYSPSVERVLGYTPEEMHSQSRNELFEPKDVEEVMSLQKSILQQLHAGENLQEQTWTFTYTAKKKNKERIWLLSTVKITYNELSEATGFIGVSRDITESKIAEQELLLSQFNLTERLKEQTCVYEISKLSEIEYLSWEGYLQNVVELIPPGYQFPKQTHVSITFGDKTIQSNKFVETNSVMSVDLTLNRKKIGQIQVYNPNDTPFLPEETKLLHNIKRSVEQHFEKVDAERSLRLSEEKYRIIANNTYNWEFWESPDGTYIYHSPSCLKPTGYTSDELVNFPELCKTILHPEDVEGYKEHHSHAGKRKDADSHFFRIITKSGEVKHIEHVCQPVFDKAGNFLGIRGTNIDITERRLADQALRESEQRFRSLVNSQTSYVIRTNMEGKHTYWNPKFEEEYGWLYTDKGMGEGNVLSSICNYHHERTFETVNKCIQSPGKIFKVELDKPGKDGKTHVTLWEFICITNDEGLPLEIQCMGIDITESKRAELKIIESEKKYKILFNDSPDAYLLIQDGVFIECNRAAEELVGGTREDILGKSPVALSPLHQPNGELSSVLAPKLLEEAAHKGKISFEWEHLKLNGEKFMVHINLTNLLVDGQSMFFTTWRDITEMRKAQNDLAISEARFSQVAEQSQTVIWELDQVGMYTYISPVAAQVFGYEPAELIGKKYFYELHPDEFQEEFKEHAMDAFNSLLDIKDFENPIIKKDGSLIWVSSNASPIFDKDKQCIGYRGADIDITKRKLAEEEMNKFKVMADQANYGTGMTSMEGIILYANEHMAQMHGYTREELIGQPMAILHSPGQTIETNKIFMELLEKGGLNAMELLHQRKDGTNFPTLTNTKLITNIKGVAPFIAGTIIDITERKNFEKEINKLNLAVDQSPVGIIITDLNGILEYVNPAFEINTGYTKEEVLGKSTKMLKSGITPTETYESLWKTIKAGNLWQGELINRKKNGELYWENMTISPIKDENGIVTNYLGIKQDISERKKAEDEILGLNLSLEKKVKARTMDLEQSNKALEKAREDADHANQAKSDFLSRMSHELRTPMNSILGFAQLMEMGELNASQQKAVSHILKSGKHLLELINEVLDISRIEAGRVSISVEPVEINFVIADLIETLQPLANSRQVKLFIENEISQSLFVRADKQRLKQVLLNLMNNAIKYNKIDGKVWVEIKHVKGTENTIRISIKDNGIGISEEDLPKVFTPFERVGAEQLNTEGTGLGLAVVKQLIGLMGGTNGAESTLGEGSNFWIELPECVSELTRIKQSGELSWSSNEIAEKRGVILYIEDNRSNIELVEQIIEAKRPGLKLISNMYGKNALSLAIENKPDLILLDLNLPDIHGVEVLEILQSHVQTKDIPVVILSADAMPKQLEILKKAGAKNYLTKPIDIQLFVNEVDKFVL